MCQTILLSLKESVSNHDGIRKNLHWRNHLKNARPHAAKITKSQIAQLKFIQKPHPPFSPDVSPYNFFLYGMLKGLLKGRSHETFDTLFISIDEILQEIPKETWEAVYDEWISRFNQVITSWGEYF